MHKINAVLAARGLVPVARSTRACRARVLSIGLDSPLSDVNDLAAERDSTSVRRGFIFLFSKLETAVVPRRKRLSALLRKVAMGFAFITLPLNRSVAAAEGDTMVIRHNVSFALSTAGLDVEESKDGTQVVITKAVRRAPFLELRFSPPIPQRTVHRKILQVFCDESGTYTSVGGSSWTIAKRCRIKD